MKSILALAKLRVLLGAGSIYLFLEWMQISGYLHSDDGIRMFIRYLVVGIGIGFAIRKSSLSHWIFVSMIIGMAIGYDFPEIAKNLNVLSKIFMKLVKCVIAPLLLGTLITGIAGHSNIKELGRLGLKALIYFEVVTTFALFIGLAAINLTQAGKGILVSPGMASEVPKLAPKSGAEILLHIFPENIA